MGERNSTSVLRLQKNSILANHTLFPDQSEHSHHPRGEVFYIVINSQSIVSGGTYTYRVSIDPDHKAIRAILRGNQSTDVQGHTGVVAMGTDNQQESMCVNIKPYGAGAYPTTYMGCYSRLHGDAYLTSAMFGGGIRLQDIYIDTATDEGVLVFYNPSILTRFMSCYGQIQVK